MRFFALFLVGFLLPALASAGEALPACGQDNAIAVVKSDYRIAYFCHSSHDGCDFKARPPSPLNADERNDKNLAWVVTASIIGGYDSNGQPQFMPEGAAFALVSKDCKIESTLGPNGPLYTAEYFLDDVSGREFALYPGIGYRSSVDPKYAAKSLAALEQMVSQLPADARIHWVPARRNSEMKPLLFGNESNLTEFWKFCFLHKVKLEIAPPSCKKNAECTTFCKDAGKGTNCLPDGIPTCPHGSCACGLTCK